MPGILSKPRVKAALESRLGRYVLYGLGEVALIFVGITLAIAFENRNEARRTADLERETLGAIHRNLAANLVELDSNVVSDRRVLASLEPVIRHLSGETPWHDSLSVELANAGRWSSPFLVQSGYQSLKQQGLHLVSDGELRDKIVNLYEHTYAGLVSEIDRAQWSLYESVVLPTRIRTLDPVDPLQGAGLTYQVVRTNSDAARRDLVAALAQHHRLVSIGVSHRQGAHAETNAVMEAITAFLHDSGG